MKTTKTTRKCRVCGSKFSGNQKLLKHLSRRHQVTIADPKTAEVSVPEPTTPSRSMNREPLKILSTVKEGHRNRYTVEMNDGSIDMLLSANLPQSLIKRFHRQKRKLVLEQAGNEKSSTSTATPSSPPTSNAPKNIQSQNTASSEVRYCINNGCTFRNSGREIRNHQFIHWGGEVRDLYAQEFGIKLVFPNFDPCRLMKKSGNGELVPCGKSSRECINLQGMCPLPMD